MWITSEAYCHHSLFTCSHTDTMSTNGTYCLSRHEKTAAILPPILIAELLLGLPGNAVALWIFCFRLKAWKTSTVYLVNLVVADFLLILSLPFRIDSYLRGEDWTFGEIFCKVNLFMVSANRSASMAFLLVVVLDRYCRVLHPYHWLNRISVRSATCVAGLTWALVAALEVHLLANPDGMEIANGNRLCRSFRMKTRGSAKDTFRSGVFLAQFYGTLVTLLFCTCRIIWKLRLRKMDKEKKIRKAMRIAITVVVIFVFCFLPGNVTGVAVFIVRMSYPGDCGTFNVAVQFFSSTVAFTYMNSVLDPVLYCFSSPGFLNTLRLPQLFAWVRKGGPIQTRS
ncbi:hydroxycarboxylic acid receptor 2-like [Amia ocellicauda]|uniref:hydroxycarboxylic acid receptor 2-like n=1 Tax=Amia ocellicauda TaxID=2972642 RepID=UPI003463CA70